MSGLWEELQWRGLVHQSTDPDLGKLIDAGGMTVYIGFDPTADSLHVGHLLQQCTLRRFQQAGHRPIALAGGGTGMIGDPGGKSEERNLLNEAELSANIGAIRRQLEHFLDFDAGALLVNNGEWLWTVGLLEFLRDVGKHFSVNEMVRKESVRARLEGREQGISFPEFSYMLLQAYDFLQLYDQHDCTLQIGGSDQWGNITLGVELIRRKRGADAYGLTTPLVLKADGTKFGKTETGTVWLSPARTSPYDLYQFFMRAEDTVVGAYLRFFTWLSREQIEELDAATAAHPERRESQRALARAVTALLHGEEEAAAAEQAARSLFESGEASADAPSSSVTLPIGLVDALVQTGLASSKSAARRDIAGGGVYVNGAKEADAERMLTGDDLDREGTVKLRKGKRTWHVLRPA
jgi:tyrosyl-tRNA synthetase